jgi:hypothetical protein
MNILNQKKLQQIVFFLIFLNCCIIICITAVSTFTDYWVLVRPYRLLPKDFVMAPLSSQSTHKPAALASTTTEQTSSSPHSKLPLTTNINLAQKNGSSYSVANLFIISTTPPITSAESFDYLSAISNAIEEDDALLPFDLHAKKDCKRYSGKIRFGLFRGVWLLNYAYGCKNRINRVSSILKKKKKKMFSCLRTFCSFFLLLLLLPLYSIVFCLFLSDRND